MGAGHPVDQHIVFLFWGSLDFVSRFGSVSLVVKKSSIRTQHERRERERDKKKSCRFRGCTACTAKVCWHRQIVCVANLNGRDHNIEVCRIHDFLLGLGKTGLRLLGRPDLAADLQKSPSNLYPEFIPHCDMRVVFSAFLSLESNDADVPDKKNGKT